MSDKKKEVIENKLKIKKLRKTIIRELNFLISINNLTEIQNLMKF